MNYKLKLHRDEYPADPREWDNLGKMVCFHSRYNLGDEQPKGDPLEWLRDLACNLDSGLWERLDYWENGAGWVRMFNEALAKWDVSMDEIKAELALAKLYYTPGATDYHLRKLNAEYAKRLNDGWKMRAIAENDKFVSDLIWSTVDTRAVILPLYLYDHSGLRLSTGAFSCPWDSGQVGWIYVSREDVLKEYGGKRLTKKLRERAERLLRGEVETYDQYLCGDVWGWVVYDDDDDEEECDCEPEDECDCTRHAAHVDSCWGYYGVADALSEGKSHLEWLEREAGDGTEG